MRVTPVDLPCGRNGRLFVLAPLLLLLVAGCGAVNQELQKRIAHEAIGLAPAVTDDDAVVEVATAAGKGEAPTPPLVEIPEDTGLEEYVSLALQRNPAIQQALRSLQALGYRVPQVTSLDDPLITILPPIGDLTETAAGVVDGGTGISQAIPFPGKLTARGRVAEQEARVAFAALADTRIRIVAAVAHAYYDSYLAEVSIEITTDSQQLLRQIRDVAAARYRAGTATQQDVLRSEVELYELTNELITLDQQRTTAHARLNTLLNRPVDADLPPTHSFDLATVDWKLPATLDRAVASNPQLAAAREQVKRDLEAIRLARLQYYPDLRIGFGYSFIGSGLSPVATGKDNWSLPFGLNLPIWWQRIRAGVLEANAQALASTERYSDVRNEIAFGVQDTLVKIDTRYRQALLFRDLLVPRAWQTVEVSTASYRAGELEFTALIDNWRQWLDFSLDYHRSLAGLEQRFADLQQLVGLRIPRTPPADGDGNSDTSTVQPASTRPGPERTR